VSKNRNCGLPFLNKNFIHNSQTEKFLTIIKTSFPLKSDEISLIVFHT
jgi:hypothetical protein